MSGKHESQGMVFYREPNGDVVVEVGVAVDTTGEGSFFVERVTTTFTPDEWARIVAHVSAEGLTSAAVSKAQIVHAGILESAAQ